VKPVRTVAFSPAGTRLAAAGDARVIALYDVSHGEQVANLTGHSAWIFSVDWSDTGEYLLSGSFDGKVKVWSIDQRTCVATHSETDKTLWCVKWLPKTGRSEAFKKYMKFAGSGRRTVYIIGSTTCSRDRIYQGVPLSKTC
jgi:superkiller protein 8